MEWVLIGAIVLFMDFRLIVLKEGKMLRLFSLIRYRSKYWLRMLNVNNQYILAWQ